MGRLTREFALGLGSNVGDRRSFLLEAARRLSRAGGVVDFQLSGIYLSQPWGGVRGGPFLNAVMTGVTTAGLPELVEACLEAEALAGAPESKNGAPRTLDVDILYLDPRGPGAEWIILPHPRMHLRRFVLEPLLSLRPEGSIPGLGAGCEALVAECPDRSHITLLEEAPSRGRLWPYVV
ncbi:2-amino-4-hydroxy-6-hydroxymethyldihydropteridine diphosphokinase [Candidatus Fermentibacteria bacterium]|nr:2-amino-4-hydroxy-6-hydroxymethyldihydropteridine diphosphokinase [Candidatus Fermentibacteria bacterium]